MLISHDSRRRSQGRLRLRVTCITTMLLHGDMTGVLRPQLLERVRGRWGHGCSLFHTIVQPSVIVPAQDTAGVWFACC